MSVGENGAGCDVGCTQTQATKPAKGIMQMSAVMRVCTSLNLFRHDSDFFKINRYRR